MKIENESELLEKEMKKLNVYYIPTSEIPDEQYLAVEVDIDCPFNVEMMKDVALTRKVFRGTVYHIIFLKNERDMLTLKVACKAPKDFIELYFESFMHQMKNSVRCTAFPDLTWINSDGTTNKDLDQVITEVRKDSILGDLTNALPSKFVDDFVEMMHVLNQGLIEGILSDAIVYGPYIFSKDQLLSVAKYSENNQLVSVL